MRAMELIWVVVAVLLLGAVVLTALLARSGPSRAEGYLAEARQALAVGHLDDAYNAVNKGLFNCPHGVYRAEQAALVREFVEILAEMIRQEGRDGRGLDAMRREFERLVEAGEEVTEVVLDRVDDAYLEARRR
jgi:hypothetical protein